MKQVIFEEKNKTINVENLKKNDMIAFCTNFDVYMLTRAYPSDYLFFWKGFGGCNSFYGSEYTYTWDEALAMVNTDGLEMFSFASKRRLAQFIIDNTKITAMDVREESGK